MSGFGDNVNGFGAFPNRQPPYLIDILVVGGGGGGFGFLERRWLLTAGGEPPVAVTSSAGNRMVQLSGRSRLGASRMATSCLACWRLSTSLLRLKARAMVKAC